MSPKLLSKTFGSLEPNYIHIHVGFIYGMNDGGTLWRVPTIQVPIDCRMPNTLLWVYFEHAKIIEIERCHDKKLIDQYCD